MPRRELGIVRGNWDVGRAAGWRSACRCRADQAAHGRPSKAMDEAPQSGEHPLIAFAQEGGEDVLADLFAPEVVAAIAPW